MLCKTFESLVYENALVPAYTQRGGIHKLMPVQVPGKTSLMKTVSYNRDSFSNFTKAVIGHTFGKKVRQMLANIFLLIMLETSETSRIEQVQNDNDFHIAHPVGLVPMLMILPLIMHFSCTLANSLQKSSAI